MNSKLSAKGRGRRRSASLLASVVVVIATSVGCSNAGREGTLVRLTAPYPTVSCSAGLGGEITITNISSELLSARVEWAFNEPADQPDYIGFFSPFRPNDPPPASVTLTSPPWSSTQSSALLAPSATVVLTAKDYSFGAKSYSCSKGSDSPTLLISCEHDSPGTLGEKATVYVHKNDLAAAGSEASQVRTSWWWKAIPTWQVVLQPWIAVSEEAHTTVGFAETTYHALPGTTSTKNPESKEFSSTPDLDYPSEYGSAFIGRVRVDVINSVGRAVSYPAQSEC